MRFDLAVGLLRVPCEPSFLILSTKWGGEKIARALVPVAARAKGKPSKRHWGCWISPPCPPHFVERVSISVKGTI
jgi:hypothetical protein